MKVMVKDRGEGKTTALIDWVLRGHPIEGKPGWSRLLLTTFGAREVDRLKQKLHEAAVAQGYIRPDDTDRHDIHRRLQEAVQDIGRTNLRGFDSTRYEIAVDDVHMLIERELGRAGILKSPDVIAINGQAWI